MLKLGALLLALFILCNSTTQRRRNVCLLRLCVYYTRCVVCCLRRNEAGHGRSASRIDALFFPSPQPVKITAHALIVRAYMPNAVTSSPQAFLSIWRDFFFSKAHCTVNRGALASGKRRSISGVGSPRRPGSCFTGAT